MMISGNGIFSDMRLMKRSCASNECSMTCPSPSCLPVGITMIGYVWCKSKRYSFRVISNSSLPLLSKYSLKKNKAASN